jgi:poly(hydroxyalkanoate) depolymerase family esterase
MARRRKSRRIRSGLWALLPKVPTLPALPVSAAPKRRSAPLRKRRVTKPAAKRAPARRPPASGRWVRGTFAGLGGSRRYDVYLPPGLRRTRVPLVVLLHGCDQTAAQFADATRFTDAADRNGFIIVLPHQENLNHPNRCWRWYEAAHQQRGAGEPALLAGIAREVLAEEVRWRADPLRTYVAGLSAGGGMALTLAATYPDVFAAAGAHSAPAYRSASRGTEALSAMAGRAAVPPPVPGAVEAMSPMIVVQGTADHVVRASSGDQVADQWLAYRRAAADGGTDPGRIGNTRTSSGRTRDGRSYTTVRWYTVRGRKVLEYWLVDGLGHAWSGGRKGGSYSDSVGPRAATLMWQFFSSHELSGGTAAPRRKASA